VAVADATDEHPAFVHATSFVEEMVPAPSTSPGVCPSLEDWKCQYRYDPLVAAKHQHIAYEHIEISNPPAPWCGMRDTGRRRMRQGTAREGLFAIDVELALGNAPTSSVHFGSGVRTVHDGTTPFPRIDTKAVYRARSHLPRCAHYAAPATTPAPPADVMASAAAPGPSLSARRDRITSALSIHSFSLSFHLTSWSRPQPTRPGRWGIR